MAKQQLSYDDQVWQETFARRLKKALVKRNLSQNQAAQILGVNRARMSQLVSGRPQNPVGIHLFRRMCIELHIDPDYLLGISKKS